MRTVWKYQMPDRSGPADFKMPAGAKVVHVKFQHDAVCLWVEVNTDEPKETRSFRIYGTGQEMPEDLQLEHVGTAITPNGAFVWHVYERT